MNKINLFPTFVFSTLGLVLIGVFICFEQRIYMWDYRGYWVQYMDLGKLAIENQKQFLDSVYFSVRSSDYNNFIVAIPSLLVPITGDTRGAFLSTLLLLYFIPFTVVFGIFLMKFTDRVFFLKVSPWIFSLLAFAFMPIWSTLLRGAPDVAGLIAMTIIVGAIFQIRSDRVHLGTALIIGVSVWSTFLARRWYAFGVIPIALLAPFLTLYLSTVVDKNPLKTAAVYTIINYAIAGSITLILLLTLQYELVMRVLGTSYGDMYDAYQRELPFHLWRVYSHFGVIPLCLSLTGAIIGIRNHHARPYVVYALACCIVTYVSFIRTQQFENHHFLMIGFWLLFLQALAISVIAKQTGFKTHSVAIAYTALVFVLPWVFLPAKINTPGYLVPSAVRPLRVANYPEYERLVEDLTSLGEEKIALIGSGRYFNDSIMSSLSGEKLTKRFVPIPHVDKMHGFMPEPFSADIIVLSNPMATHLIRGQEVIRIYADSFKRFVADGTYTQVGGNYTLAEGIVAQVFKKNRPITREQITRVFDDIYAIYPGWRQRYENSLLQDRMLSVISPGDMWGFVWFNMEKNRIEAHPGQTTPTTFTLETGRNLGIGLVRPCEGSDGVVVSIEGNGERLETTVTKTEPTVFDTSKFVGPEIKLTIANNKNPTCDHTFIEVAK
ncbi:hypothetical protein M1D80_14085 [Phyllobacteriaceae bacterium JZ32]